MDCHHNLPPEQRRVQRIVDRFNADEQIWRRLEPRRRLRRAIRKHLTETQLRKLDLREFASSRPPEDCVGEWIER